MERRVLSYFVMQWNCFTVPVSPSNSTRNRKLVFHVITCNTSTWNWDSYTLSKYKICLLQKCMHDSTHSILVTACGSAISNYFLHFYHEKGLMFHFMIFHHCSFQGPGILIRWLNSLLWALRVCSSLLFSVYCILNICLRFSSIHLQISDSC